MTKERLQLIQKRMAYSGKGAFIGAMIGAFVGKRMAGLGGAVGAMLGATVAETKWLRRVRAENTDDTETNK